VAKHREFWPESLCLQPQSPMYEFGATKHHVLILSIHQRPNWHGVVRRAAQWAAKDAPPLQALVHLAACALPCTGSRICGSCRFTSSPMRRAERQSHCCWLWQAATTSCTHFAALISRKPYLLHFYTMAALQGDERQVADACIVHSGGTCQQHLRWHESFREGLAQHKQTRQPATCLQAALTCAAARRRCNPGEQPTLAGIPSVLPSQKCSCSEHFKHSTQHADSRARLQRSCSEGEDARCLLQSLRCRAAARCDGAFGQCLERAPSPLRLGLQCSAELLQCL
jgi:hypothetical protein